MEKLIDKIKKRGYWKIIIRPIEFKADRISDKEKAEKTIESSKLSFRGWDYPHIDRDEKIFPSGPDSVSSFCDWPEGQHFEFWKLYLNGQFVHYFSMPEDYSMDEQEKEKARRSLHFSGQEKNDSFFSIINALYSITEIHFFAANLAKLVDFGEKVEILVELGGVKGRVLFFWGDPFRYLSQTYPCHYEPIIQPKIVDTKELISNPGNLALDFFINILKEFTWKGANKEVFIGDQKKLIEHSY
ncbi:MAG: hypothetical protein WC451_04825 [Patescibacteria group bacterium]